MSRKNHHDSSELKYQAVGEYLTYPKLTFEFLSLHFLVPDGCAVPNYRSGHLPASADFYPVQAPASAPALFTCSGTGCVPRYRRRPAQSADRSLGHRFPPCSHSARPCRCCGELRTAPASGQMLLFWLLHSC